ncbi:MAG: hypothetical protein PHT95_06735 [Candidatus Omnitrophica bacterium]|nr:hypothetical protein [Candidatus Omnitrophota bacterium]
MFPAFESLRDHFRDYNYPPLNAHFRYILIALIALLYVSCAKTSAMMKTRPEGSVVPIWIFAVLIYAATIPPIFSIDLYEYVIRGRMSAMYGLNPFTHTPEAVSSDPLYPVIFWKNVVSLYGPLWNLIAEWIVKLTGPDAFANVGGFKAASFAAHTLTYGLILSISRKTDAPKSAYTAALFLLNPYLIFMDLVENHNDVFMMLFVVLAFWLLSNRRYIFAIAALALSVAVKYISVILFPVFFIYIWKQDLEIKSKLFFTVGGAMSAGLLYYAIFTPFGITPMTLFSAFHGVTLSLENNTIPFLTRELLARFGIFENIDAFRSACNIAFLAAAGSIYCLLSVRKRMNIERAAGAALLLFLAYLIIASFQFGCWYVVWIAPLIVLAGVRKKELLLALVTLAALLSFWKRINFLMIAAIMIYLAALSGSFVAKRVDGLKG